MNQIIIRDCHECKDCKVNETGSIWRCYRNYKILDTYDEFRELDIIAIPDWCPKIPESNKILNQINNVYVHDVEKYYKENES